MSDDKNLVDDLGDLEWDSALDEWEKNTFVPEVAKDTDLNKMAPTSEEQAREHLRAAASAIAGIATGASHSELNDLSGEAMVIAPVPQELRGESPPRIAREEPPRLSSKPPLVAPPQRASAPPGTLRGGGLGQLFAKSFSVRPPLPAAKLPPTPPPASETTRAVLPFELADIDDFDDAKPDDHAESELDVDSRAPSVTRQLASRSVPPERHILDSDGVETRDGRGHKGAELSDLADDDERSANEALTRDGREVEDAPTISTRDIQTAAARQTLARAPLVHATDDADDADDASGSFDSETVVADRNRLGLFSDADAEARSRKEEGDGPSSAEQRLGPLPADDEAPTIMRPSAAPARHVLRTEPPLGRALAVAAAELEGERPVSRWLDEATTTSFRQRASWLEEEARALGDPREQARALLGVSELLALVGEATRAHALATEARDLAPGLALAWRQARQLMPRGVEPLVEALDAEAARSPTPASRAHATLMAADVLRTSGDGDAAVERWTSACKLDPADVRAPAARAALALAQNNHSIAGAELAENSELIALDKAVATALKLRGAPRVGGDHVDAPLITDGLRRARDALFAQDVVGAARALTDVVTEPALTSAVLWLSAMLGATHIAGRRGSAKSLKTLASKGDMLARRQLAARGIELGDPELVRIALDDDAPIDTAERATLFALAGLANPDQVATFENLGQHVEYAVLLDALAAVDATYLDATDAAVITRSRRTAGTPNHRALSGLGRLLASRPSGSAIDDALTLIVAPRGPAAAGVALESAVKMRRWDEVSEALSALPTGEDAVAAAQRHLAAALVAERAGNRENSARAWREALTHGASHDAVVRALARLDPQVDLGAELLRIADEMPDGAAGAVLRLEALARREGATPPLSDDEQVNILEHVHRGAPTLGLGAFLAERIGRRKGDVEQILRWIQERRSYASEALESALDAVREAWLVAGSDADLAGTRLEEAHRARPDDFALRELFERLATDPPTDGGAWRERRAEKSAGVPRAVLFTEASLAHERAGDSPASLRAAQQAFDAGEAGLSRLAKERAEIATGNPERQIRELIAQLERTTTFDSEATRRKTCERLAELELQSKAHIKEGSRAALGWHRRILEESPRHKPSLRFVEHHLITEGREEDIERIFEQIAFALDGTSSGEVAGHAQLSTRLKARVPGGWERSIDIARLAAIQPEPSLWALRALNAHARVQKDEEARLATTEALLERTQRPSERGALLLRASEAAARLERVDDARTFLEQAANEDPGNVVTWGFLAEVRERKGEQSAAADACESLARASVVPEHQLLAWFDAARIWLDEVDDADRGTTALEQCAAIDITHGDVFQRLSRRYAEKHLDAELARLLEKRLAVMEDEGERVALEVELARAHADMGDFGKAKASLESALAQRPNHTTALGALAELCAKDGDWTGAEQAYVRLARLLNAPDDQRAVYEKLGEIYTVHAVNLARAEVAYNEVLKRAPNDIVVLLRMVEIYKRANDVPRAIAIQQQIVAEASEPDVRLQRLIDLAQIHESTARDARRAEQVLESARKEFPTSVVALRAMAEFYARQRQMPAMQILLDRAAADARRSFAAGRFVTSLFEILHAAYELRGRKDAARVVAATLAAVEGPSTSRTGAQDLLGAEARAVDPRLDDILAPELIGPALRALFHHAGDTLDVVSPIDLRQLRATPLVPGTSLGTTVGAVATVVGLGALQILISPQLGRVAIPLGSNPPALLVGEGLVSVPNERARAFVVIRAIKMILSRSSSVLRGPPADVGVLVSALFTAFNPSFSPQGVDAQRVASMSRRLLPALPRNLDPTVGVIALEAAGTLGSQSAMLGAAAHAWANRVALLAIGDPNGALDAIAWSKGEEAAPRGSEERAAWIARNAEARELMTFSVTDAYAEARSRLGLDR